MSDDRVLYRNERLYCMSLYCIGCMHPVGSYNFQIRALGCHFSFDPPLKKASRIFGPIYPTPSGHLHAAIGEISLSNILHLDYQPVDTRHMDLRIPNNIENRSRDRLCGKNPYGHQLTIPQPRIIAHAPVGGCLTHKRCRVIWGFPRLADGCVIAKEKNWCDIT
jgi:hypothetical protein